MFFVMFSYLQVIGVYTRIGGSYVVARDNFGPKVAQVAAVALLIDYTVTVAVQTSAGTAALTSAYQGAHAVHGADHRRRDPAHAVRQPARHPRGGRRSSRSRRTSTSHRCRSWWSPGWSRPRSAASMRTHCPAPHTRLPDRPAQTADGSWGWASSTASRPSPTAASRSPGWKRCPTASRASARRSRATVARRS